MSLNELKASLPDYARDTKLNLGSVLSPEGAPDLSANQIFGIALASAYATRSAQLVQAIHAEAASILTQEEVNAARAAATVMAMNNVYYRFIHLVEDQDFAHMPAKLRMNVIGNPGIAKLDFELMSLAVSAINGCGKCMEAHVNEVLKHGVTKTTVQSCIRIASVVNAAAQAVVIKDMIEPGLSQAA